jgi:sugar phosphate isomerase/epimerase
MTYHTVSRRQILAGAAASALAGAADARPAGERYQLGVMTSVYASVPLDDAMTRIRKAGYRFVCPGARHGGETVFAPTMAKADRTRVLRRMRDLGVQPFCSLGGFLAPGELQTDQSLEAYNAQLDLCADFEIPVMVGGGPWSYTKFPNLPKSQREFQPLVDRFFANMEKAVRHAESVRVIIALKPHTGITARARDCIQVAGRINSPYFKIAWDAGNVSFYEGIYPDPDLPDLAPKVAAVCLKDHKGLRGEADFPVPGQGNVDHELMFKTLFAAGFNGPLAIERVDGRDGGRVSPDVIDQRLTAANQYLVPLLDRITAR